MNMEWQPIETYVVPRECPVPSFIGGNSATGFVGECYWSHICQELHCCGAPIEITHWMPLPEPPTQDSE